MVAQQRISGQASSGILELAAFTAGSYQATGRALSPQIASGDKLVNVSDGEHVAEVEEKSQNSEPIL